MGISFNYCPNKAAASHWVAPTLLITAETTRHLYPQSLFWWNCCQLGRTAAQFSNYFWCKMFYITTDLIRAQHIKYALRAGGLFRWVRWQKPFWGFGRLMNTSHPSVFHIHFPVIIVFWVFAGVLSSPLKLTPQSLFIDIYMRRGPPSDWDLSDALIETRPLWAPGLVWDQTGVTAGTSCQRLHS